MTNHASVKATPMTAGQASAWAQALGLPRFDAQVLLLHAIGRAPHDRAWLLAHGDDLLNDTVQTRLQRMHNDA